MKIMHVAETAKGGVGTILEQIVNYQSNDNSIYLLIPKEHQVYIRVSERIKVYNYNRTKRGFVSLAKLMFCFLISIFKSKPDIVHLHSTFAGLICRPIIFLIKPFHKCKVVYSPHAFSFMMVASRSKIKFYKFVERFLAKITDLVICTSNYELESAMNAGIKCNAVTVYNSIKPPKTIFNTNPFDKESLNLLFVGRLDYQKGVDKIILAASSLPDNINIYLIGDSVVDDYKIVSNNKLHFLGWVNNDELGDYYYYCDAVIMPSRWESFGLVAVESQSYGTPVIASNNTSLPEVIINRKTGFLLNGSFEKELINILTSYSADDFKKMSNECIENYIENFETSKMCKGINYAYQKYLF